MTQKKRHTLFLALLLFITLSSPIESRKAVGLVWTTEAEIVDQDSTYCVTYGAYNPLDEDVTVQLTLEGDLANVVHITKNEPVTVHGGTTHLEPVELETCFDIPRVYQQDCILGLLCEQECSEGIISYKGEVSIVETAQETTAKGAGSKVSVGVAAPLELRVKCSPTARNWTPAIIFAAGLATLFTIFWLLRTLRRRHPPQNQ